MESTIQIKKVNNSEDLDKIVSGDVVIFGLAHDFGEESLVYDYPGLEKSELMLVSRLKNTGIPGGLGVILENRNDLRICNGAVNITYTCAARGKQPTTKDGKIPYGVTLYVKKSDSERDKQFENPEMYDFFDKALNGAGL